MTELVVHMRGIDTVFPYERNAKKHPVGQVEQIAKSISDFDLMFPFLLTRQISLWLGPGVILQQKN